MTKPTTKKPGEAAAAMRCHDEAVRLQQLKNASLCGIRRVVKKAFALGQQGNERLLEVLVEQAWAIREGELDEAVELMAARFSADAESPEA